MTRLLRLSSSVFLCLFEISFIVGGLMYFERAAYAQSGIAFCGNFGQLCPGACTPPGTTCRLLPFCPCI